MINDIRLTTLQVMNMTLVLSLDIYSILRVHIGAPLTWECPKSTSCSTWKLEYFITWWFYIHFERKLFNLFLIWWCPYMSNSLRLIGSCPCSNQWCKFKLFKLCIMMLSMRFTSSKMRHLRFLSILVIYASNDVLCKWSWMETSKTILLCF